MPDSILGLSRPPLLMFQLNQHFPLPAPSRYLLKREEEERLFNYACRLPRRGAPVKGGRQENAHFHWSPEAG